MTASLAIVLGWATLSVMTLGAVGCTERDQTPAITVACAAVMRAPIEEITSRFTNQSQIEVEIRFGGSNTLLTQLKISAGSDVYVAADSAYTKQAFNEGLIESSRPIATVVPVIVTRPTSRIERLELEQLASPSLRIAIANPKTAAIGRNAKAVLEGLDLWDSVASNVQARGVMFTNVNEVASAVAVGSVDAGVVWDSVAMNDPNLSVFKDERWEIGKGTIEIAMVKGCRNRESVQSFIDHMASDSGSRDILLRCGFRPYQ